MFVHLFSTYTQTHGVSEATSPCPAQVQAHIIPSGTRIALVYLFVHDANISQNGERASPGSCGPRAKSELFVHGVAINLSCLCVSVCPCVSVCLSVWVCGCVGGCVGVSVGVCGSVFGSDLVFVFFSLFLSCFFFYDNFWERNISYHNLSYGIIAYDELSS